MNTGQKDTQVNLSGVDLASDQVGAGGRKPSGPGDRAFSDDVDAANREAVAVLKQQLVGELDKLAPVNLKIPPQSKATTANPKDLFGAVKVSLTKLPAIGVLHGAHAMMDGARKYGPYNWRDKKVIASIYADAVQRHVLAWFEGQETAADSGVHHLGHAIACCALLLDAQATGNLIDDRPICDDPDKLARILDELNAKIKLAALLRDSQK